MKNVRKETGIEYLKEVYKNDFRNPLVFDSAELKQLNIMDNFSKWLADNEWELNYTTGKWEKLDDEIQILPFSELYQIYLKINEA